MDAEGIGLVLGRASELRSKISNAINSLLLINNNTKENDEEEEDDDDDRGGKGGENGEQEEGEEASLSHILDAFELLETQLSSLQELQQQQIYEREAALAEIDNSRQKLLKKLKEYNGEDLEVISEATAFASETVEENNDLLLPPYPSRPSHPVVSGNGYLSHSSAARKFPQNGVANGDSSNGKFPQESERNIAESGPKSSLILFIKVVAKTAVTLVGVVSALTLAGFEPRLGRGNTQFKVSGLFQQQATKEKRTNECPPGKVLVFEDGEARCLVKERVEIPFKSVVAKPDVNYGCG